MAAHIVTIMRECVEFPERNTPELIGHAIDFAPGMNMLDWDDYISINNLVTEIRFKKIDREKLYDHIKELLPKYEIRWQEAGKPRTYEDWVALIRKEENV